MFKKIVLSAASAVATSTSSLFFTLLYREMFREVYEATEDPVITVKEMFHLGYLGAEESAERQKVVFRLFPEKPEKILEYMPLLWQLVLGLPMEDYNEEWDRSDAERPILSFRSKTCPLEYELGKDKKLDNLPWKKLWDGQNGYGYGAIITGMLTQAASFILKIKNVNKAILVTQSQEPLRNDPFFTLKCQIIPVKELPKFTPFGMELKNEITLDKGKSKDIPTNHEIPKESSDNSTTSKKTIPSSEPEPPEDELHEQSFMDRITNKFTIDKLEDLFGRPTGAIEVTIKSFIEKSLHMNATEAIDHFTNFEPDLIRVFGFLSVHLLNELGRIPAKIFENVQLAKIYGHIFILVKKNVHSYIPQNVVETLKKFFIEIFESMAPPQFITNFKKINDQSILDFYMEGSQKAIQDLGVPFKDLKASLYDELQKPNDSNLNNIPSIDIPQSDRNKVIYDIVQESFLVMVALLSIPGQLALSLGVSTASATSEIFSTIFKTINERSKNIIDLMEKIKNTN